MKLTLTHGEREYHVELLSGGRVRVDDRIVEAVESGSNTVRVEGADAWVASREDTIWVFWDGRAYEFSTPQRAIRRRGARHHGGLTAPMPATVRRILVAPGETVKAGDTLLILEAMKMELPVRAPAAGTVKTISCREGELVQPGVALLEVE